MSDTPDPSTVPGLLACADCGHVKSAHHTSGHHARIGSCQVRGCDCAAWAFIATPETEPALAYVTIETPASVLQDRIDKALIELRLPQPSEPYYAWVNGGASWAKRAHLARLALGAEK